jgi:hypothetical protein
VTAGRIRVIVQQICNHAIRDLLVTTNPAQSLRGAIARASVEHHRHLSQKEPGAFWRKLDEQGAHTTAIAQRAALPVGAADRLREYLHGEYLILHTVARPGATRSARAMPRRWRRPVRSNPACPAHSRAMAKRFCSGSGSALPALRLYAVQLRKPAGTSLRPTWKKLR